MSKYFNIRHPLTVTIADTSHDYFIRELGYLHLQEIMRKSREEADKALAGLALMQAVVLASVEEPDGTLSYTADTWRDEVQHAVVEVGKAAMKAQGIDIDKAKDEPELTLEQSEGNESPPRNSGVSSPSTSAARSENSKAA